MKKTSLFAFVPNRHLTFVSLLQGINAPLLSAPTYHEKFVRAKIEHIAKVTLDIRQKRAKTAMKKLSRTHSIN